MCATRNSLLFLLHAGRCRTIHTTSKNSFPSLNLNLNRPQCYNSFFLSMSLPLRRLEVTPARSMKTLCYRTPHVQSRTLPSSMFPLGGTRIYGVLVKSHRVTYTNGAATPKKAQSYTDKVKVIMKEYGAVGVIFHTVISLFSLGTCYFLVSR